jgi:carbon storage regulator
MLILKRKIGEAIYIDNKIKVMVTKVENGAVSLGIEAPVNIEIMRQELALNRFKKLTGHKS